MLRLRADDALFSDADSAAVSVLGVGTVAAPEGVGPEPEPFWIDAGGETSTVNKLNDAVDAGCDGCGDWVGLGSAGVVEKDSDSI